MDKILEEFINEMLGKNTEERKENIEKAIKSAKNLLDMDKTECMICITNNGIVGCGTTVEELALLGMIIQELKKKIPVELLKKSVESGFEDDDNINKHIEESKERVKERLEKIKDLIEKM